MEAGTLGLRKDRPGLRADAWRQRRCHVTPSVPLPWALVAQGGAAVSSLTPREIRETDGLRLPFLPGLQSSWQWGPRKHQALWFSTGVAQGSRPWEVLWVEVWAAGVSRRVTRSPLCCILPSHVGASSCIAARCLVLGRHRAMLVGAVK